MAPIDRPAAGKINPASSSSNFDTGLAILAAAHGASHAFSQRPLSRAKQTAGVDVKRT